VCGVECVWGVCVMCSECGDSIARDQQHNRTITVTGHSSDVMHLIHARALATGLLSAEMEAIAPTD
jgi:hypothetical protein